jgi:hypothetical protein
MGVHLVVDIPRMNWRALNGKGFILVPIPHQLPWDIVGAVCGVYEIQPRNGDDGGGEGLDSPVSVCLVVTESTGVVEAKGAFWGGKDNASGNVKVRDSVEFISKELDY